MKQDTSLSRARRPQVGDKFIGQDGATSVRVVNIVFTGGIEEVHIIHERNNVENADEMPLDLYRELATNAIKGGHEFTPVAPWEEDEE